VTSFEEAVQRAVERGLQGAALIDRDGKVIASAGVLDHYESQQLAAFVARNLKGEALAERVFTGELVPFDFDGRDALLGVAARCLFVVAIAPRARRHAAEHLHKVVTGIVSVLLERAGSLPPAGSPPGSPSGPAQLPLIELGITVRRGKA
jgi:predicted regulator of Ras-like GTPase activity (Roadblock/LC7/MglB family)